VSDYLTRMQVALLNCESDRTEFVTLSPETVREVIAGTEALKMDLRLANIRAQTAELSAAEALSERTQVAEAEVEKLRAELAEYPAHETLMDTTKMAQARADALEVRNGELRAALVRVRAAYMSLLRGCVEMMEGRE
jgi:hypothetical protein